MNFQTLEIVVYDWTEVGFVKQSINHPLKHILLFLKNVEVYRNQKLFVCGMLECLPWVVQYCFRPTIHSNRLLETNLWLQLIFYSSMFFYQQNYKHEFPFLKPFLKLEIRHLSMKHRCRSFAINVWQNQNIQRIPSSSCCLIISIVVYDSFLCLINYKFSYQFQKLTSNNLSL